MKSSILFSLLLLFTGVLSAKEQPWQDAKVVGTSLAGGYWVRGASHTYVMKRSNARLTLGGAVRVYSDGKNLHFVDNEGKERKCPIVKEMTNALADDFLAKEAAKTPEQLAAEKAQRDALELQRQALRQQAIRDIRGQKVEVEVKDCTKYPALCVH